MSMAANDSIRALILCGGFATRLDPITYFVPKSLLPIGSAGKPIVEYILDDLAALGMDEVLISTNAKFLGHFEYWAGNISREHDVKIDFVVEGTVSNSEKLGAIKGIRYAIEEAKIDTDLLIVAGDNLYDFSVKGVIDDLKKYGKPVVGLFDVGSVDEARKMGVVELKGNRIVAFSEKPAEPKTTMISTGIYAFPKEMLGSFGEYLDGGNNPDAVGYFIKWLSERKEVIGHLYEGKWHDIGTLDTYRKVFDEYSRKQ